MLTGFQALSFPEVAAMLFEKSGPRYPISAGELSEESKTHLRGRGLPALRSCFRSSTISNYECQLLVRALRARAYASVKCSRTRYRVQHLASICAPLAEGMSHAAKPATVTRPGF